MLLYFIRGGLMDIKLKKREILRFLKYKNINPRQYDKAYRLLEEYKVLSGNLNFYYNIRGQYLYREGKYEEAKECFLEQLALESESFSPHFHLYKINVLQGNYEDALVNLNSYRNNYPRGCDVNLPYNMLCSYIDLSNSIDLYLNVDYSLESSNFFGRKKIEDSNVLELYEKIIENFNARDYISMKYNLDQLDKYVETNCIALDIHPLKKLLSDLTTKIKATYQDEIDKKFEDDRDAFEIGNLLNSSIETKGLNTKVILNYIDKLIYKDEEVALAVLNNLSSQMDFSNYLTEINWLKNKIVERKKYNDLDDIHKEFYDLCIRKGLECIDTEKYEEALKYFEIGKTKTKHPIFDYYIGKTYFKLKNSNNAFNSLSAYEKNGGEKFVKTAILLKIIGNVDNKENKTNKRNIKAKKIIDCFDSCKGLHLPISVKGQYKNFDSAKEKATKRLYMKEKDFIIEDLDISSYGKCSFYEKLAIARQLYQTNNKEFGDRILNSLELLCNNEKERIALQRERKMKKLYINQAKRNS